MYSIRSKAIYYKGNIKGINSKKRNINKGQNDEKDSKSETQLFICASNVLFMDNFVDKKSL